jgi:hypothetical protein
VDAVPDPLLLRKSGSAGNRTRTYGSTARSYDTEAVVAGAHLLNLLRFGRVVLHPSGVPEVCVLVGNNSVPDNGTQR